MRTAELTLTPTDEPEPLPQGDARPLDELLPAGTRVDVRNTLDGRWTKGFEILEAGPAGYRLRRASDGRTLPTTFSTDDVRREKRSGTWWY